MSARVTRRKFLAASAATAAAGLPCPMFARAARPGERLNVAVIGVNNRGGENLKGVAHENVVALCDVDEAWSAKAREQFPKAAFFTDYRKLFDKMAKDIDAVVVSTPDHSHALPAALALTLGKHVYCEKPLAPSVNEVRYLTKLAADKKLVTQMGTQIHAGENYRRVVEVVRSGVLGEVKQVWVWNSSKPVGGKKLAGVKPSAKFDLDLWRGPCAAEFFEAEMNKSNWNYPWPHFHWRWWWEFGGGTLADLGCHYIDLPFWALGLTAPTSLRAAGDKTYAGDNTVPDVMKVEYKFRMKGGGEVELVWEHGGSAPTGAPKGYKGYPSGVAFVGTKGRLVADYNKHMLLPEEFAKDFKAPPPSIGKSIGHHKEWTEACKGNGKTTCPFEYSGPLTETVLLGNVAYRTTGEVTWDAAKCTTGNKDADALLAREYRKGWELPEV